MAYQAKVMYNFDAEGNGELTVRAGDIMTITNTDVGEGWVFGVGVEGKEGLVPEGYIERITDTMYAPLGRQVSNNDVWDDDFDSDDDQEEGSITPGRNLGKELENKPKSRPPSTGAGFFPFGKSDKVCDYLIGATEASATDGKDAIEITEPSNGYFQWKIHEEPFTCIIGSPKKNSKFGGMKTFIEYAVIPSFSKKQVFRRYKHFDWLHERLVKKFGMIAAIPPLPEKQVTGRFEEDLIEHRRVQLQSFVDRICRHPMLSTSEVWMHFLTETNDKKWTQGKRRIESDQNVGMCLLPTIQAPSISKETEQAIDEKIVTFTNQVGKLESALKNMKHVANDQIHRYRVGNTKDYKEIGKAFAQIEEAVPNEAPCLKNIGSCFQEMADMWEKQVSKDWEPVQHMMYDYKGLSSGWQRVLSLYTSMKEKQKEIQNTDGWEKEKFSAEARINTYRIAVEAERTFFNQELGIDMTQISQIFLAEQINFHRQVSDQLEKLYYECWPGQAGRESFKRASELSGGQNHAPTEWD